MGEAPLAKRLQHVEAAARLLVAEEADIRHTLLQHKGLVAAVAGIQ